MHRIDTPSATLGNEFQDGNPSLGIPATEVDSDWANAVQEEIAYVIEQSGASLIKGTNTQLYAAIASIVPGSVPSATTSLQGKVELATNAETVTGTDTTRAVTPAGVKAAIDALVDAAPGALDTLNELAAALGDDPNFAATVTAALATKIGAADTVTFTNKTMDTATNTILNMASVCQFRLTLTSGTPVTPSDVTAATTVYVAPYLGNSVMLRSGGAWVLRRSAQIAIAVPATTNTNYDVFLYDNAGTVTTELVAWTNANTRATAISYSDGIAVKNGDTSRRYIGSFRTTAVSGQTENSRSNRFVWNMYNRVAQEVYALETTTSNWTYTTNAWRIVNNSAANAVNVLQGLPLDSTTLTAVSWVKAASGTPSAACGIGLNSNTVNSAQQFGSIIDSVTTHQSRASYHGILPVGLVTISWLENSQAFGTTTWYGAGAAVGGAYPGLHGFHYC